MFEKVKEIIAKIKANSEQIKEYGEKIKSAKRFGGLAKLDEEQSILLIENRILKDNARNALFDEVMPKAVEIWNKYAGKQYGEKTKEKIRKEVEEATGCYLYATSEYSSDKFFLAPSADLRVWNWFSSRDLEVYPHPYNSVRLLVNNKIQTVNIENLKLGYCSAYVEDSRTRAIEINDKKKELRSEFEEYGKKIKAFNELLPSGIDYIYVQEPKWYNIG